MRKKALKAALFLPATLACVSASNVQPDYFWTIGPLLEKRASTVHIEALSSRYSSAFWFCEMKKGTWSRVVQGAVSSCPKDGLYRIIDAEVSSLFWSRGATTHLHFGLSKYPYSTDLDYSYIYLNVFEDIVPEKDDGILFFDQDEIQETANRVYVYDPWTNPNRRFIIHEAYEASGIFSGRDIPSRRVPLEDIALDYYNPYLLPLEEAKAELRILTHPQDFHGMGEDKGGYRAIPLATVIESFGDWHRYQFSLDRGYLYSAIDCSVLEKWDSLEPCFTSTSLFLPLRKGHDQSVYAFQISLEQAGHYGDTVILSGSVKSTRAYFGPCDVAQYCVVIG